MNIAKTIDDILELPVKNVLEIAEIILGHTAYESEDADMYIDEALKAIDKAGDAERDYLAKQDEQACYAGLKEEMELKSDYQARAI